MWETSEKKLHHFESFTIKPQKTLVPLLTTRCRYLSIKDVKIPLPS